MDTTQTQTDASTKDSTELERNATRASTLLKTMANEWRLLILCHLSEGERSVKELEDLVGLRQSALSQHLALLRREHVVKTRRSAQSIYYSLESPVAIAVMNTLYEAYCRNDGKQAAYKSN